MKALQILTAIISAAACAVIIFDFIPFIRRWLSRIKIGQWNTKEDWSAAVQEAMLAQLKKTPVVPLSDNTRLTIMERLKGTYKSKNLQNWQQAALLLGANELCDCDEVKGQLKKFIDSKIDYESGEWIEWSEKAENAMLAFAILSSPVCVKQKIKPAMKKTAEVLFDMAEKYKTIPYDISVSDIRFVDTVGMVCPFLIKYGLTYSDENAVELGIRQLKEFCETGLNKDFCLPIHCFDKRNNLPLGIFAWGRGCGWFALGLMDSFLSLLEAPNPDIFRDSQAYIFKKMSCYADTLLNYQTTDGAWCRQILLADSGESSATAMIGWFMKKMFVLTGDQKYNNSAEQAKKFLISCTRLNGTVDYAQGDTKGIGFYSLIMDSMPAALGFALRIK